MNKKGISLSHRIMIIVIISVFLTSWLFALQVLRTTRKQVMSKVYEGALMEQHMLANSVKIFAENALQRDSQDIGLSAEIIRSAVNSYDLYYKKDTAWYRIVKEDGNEIFSNMDEELETSYILDFDKTQELSVYQLANIGEYMYVFVSSNVPIADDFYLFEYAEDITQIINEQIKMARDVSVLLVFVTLGVFLLLFFSIKHTLKPLSQLSVQARHISNGEYSLRVVVNTNDEVGQLAEDFNQMAEAIELHTKTLEEKMKQQELFSANLAHEIKTPVTSIIGYTDLAMHLELEPDKQYELLEYIHKEGKRIDDLSKSLLQLSQIKNGEIEFLNIKTDRFIKHLLHILQPMLEKKQLELKVITNISVFYGNEALLTSLLVNLVHNAIKASSDKQVIELFMDKIESEYCMIVKDNGVGIPKEELVHILEPFYMVDKSRAKSDQGSGLGLALCDTIVKLHHGVFTIKSKVGSGTSVQALIPTSFK